jgi:uncharacterized protein (DUF2126 family)
MKTFVLIFFALAVFAPISISAQSATHLPSAYVLSIDVRSDTDSFTTYKVTLRSGRANRVLPTSEVGRYSLISFNRPKDLLWAGCADNYRLVARTTTTRSSTTTQDESDPEHAAAGVVFNERQAGKPFNLTIRCSK